MPIRFKIILIFLLTFLLTFSVFTLFIFTNFPDSFGALFSTKGALVVLLFLTLTFLSTVIFSAIFSKFVMRPISYLTRTVKKVRDGELDTKFHYHARDEIGQLSAMLSEMTREIKDSYSDLSKEQLKDEVIIDSIGEAVIVTNEQGEISLVNKNAEEMFGIRDTYLLGRSIYEAIIVEDEKGSPMSLYERPCKKTITEGVRVKKSAIVSSQNSKGKIPVIVTASPFILANKIIGAVNVYHDVTSERQMEKAKDEFLSIAAHQLRTPLGTMRWDIERILNRRIGEVSLPVEKILRDIFDSNMQLIELVNNLLDVSRINQGKIQNNPVVTDIEKLTKELINQMQSEAIKKSVVIEFSRQHDAEKLPEITIDPRLFKQIAQNLLSNAIKYTRTGDKITINVSYKDKLLHLVVADTGIGIPQDEQSKIFQKFTRGSNALDSSTEGTGLGLFVVKSYVDYLKGKISLNSEEGKGTRIEVWLMANG